MVMGATGEERQLPDFNLDTSVVGTSVAGTSVTGTTGKYRSTITNILSKHSNEIRSNIDDIITNELNLDASLQSVMDELSDGLRHLETEKGGLDDFLNQMRWLVSQYKNIGEEVMRLEALLLTKIDLLDKLHNRIPLITNLANNDALADLIDAFSKYAETVFKSCDFEKVYKELIEAYKKWNICREVMTINRIVTADAVDAPKCSICLNDSVSYTLVPCGHTFCGVCSKKQNLSCYICRSAIRERVKLFFG